MKLYDEIFQHYSQILDDLIKDSDYLKAYYQAPSAFEGGIFYNAGDVIITCGATRNCVIDTTYDYVVKFDIEEDEDGSVCEREEAIYDAACECGMGRYFAASHYIGTYVCDVEFPYFDDIEREADVCYFDDDEDNFQEIYDEVKGYLKPHTIHFCFPLYAYPKAKTDNPNPTPFMTNEQIYSLRATKSPLVERNVEVGWLFLKEYGMDEYQKFTRFARRYHINDLHFHNIGFINGELCFIDYGGFHDCDYYSTDDNEENWDYDSTDW